MAKSSGGTRASASSSPRGLGRMESAAGRLDSQYDIAERFYANKELTVDPGDAVYEAARFLRTDQIGDSIDNLTDYSAIPEVARGGAITGITIMPKYDNSRDLVSEYGDDSFRIPLESQSLMDIITELRSSSMTSLFRKYR